MRDPAETTESEHAYWEGKAESAEEVKRLKEQIEALTAQLSSIRDAGDEEVNGAANMIYLSPEAEVSVINRLRDIAISRGQQRDEVVGLLKWVRNRMYLDFEDFERDAENPEYSNARRILEIVEGK